MSTVDNLRRLRQHFTQEQAEDILAVIESQTVTREYLDSRLTAMRDYLDRRFTEVDRRFTEVDSRVNGVDSRFTVLQSELDRRFTDVDSRFSGVDSRFTVLRSEIDARLEAMEKRLILWGIGLTGVIVTLVTTLERAIPR